MPSGCSCTAGTEPGGRRWQIALLVLTMSLPVFPVLAVQLVQQKSVILTCVVIASPIIPVILLKFVLCSLMRATSPPAEPGPSDSGDGCRNQPLVSFESFYPSRIYENRADADTPAQLCCICLDMMVGGQACRDLSCRHCFHTECIDSWWLQNVSAQVMLQCPMCRQASLAIRCDVV
mmetsp:Transcript_127933/g.368576  ORF Transcript_127933/g.368576 Transcript_127933/m.368576 type:complete len:177 (+) Transcript_127933:104-634(+)